VLNIALMPLLVAIAGIGLAILPPTRDAAI